MILSLIVFLFEFLTCKILINPTNEAEHNIAALTLLIINIIVVFLDINFSVRNSKSPNEESRIKKLILFSFVMRITILFWDIYARNIFVLPNSEGDAEWYHKIGVKFAFGSLSNSTDYGNYQYYVGQLYKLIGVQKMTVQFLHIFFAIFSIILIYRILLMFEISPKIRTRTIAIVCFLPNLMMITTFFLQESTIAFLIVLSLYLYTKWWFNGGVLNIVFSVAVSVFAAMLHIGGIVTAVGIISMLSLTFNRNRVIRFSPFKIIFLVISVFVMLAVISMFGDELLGKLGGEISSSSITGEVSLKEAGGGSYVIGISGLSPTLDLIVNTPVRVIYFLFSPLPWDWRGASDILAFFGSVTFYIYAVWNIIKAIKTKPLKQLKNDSLGSYFIVLVVIITVAAVMFGWGVSNSGSALRHREKFTYIFAIAFAISGEIIQRARSRNETNKNIGNNTGL